MPQQDGSEAVRMYENHTIGTRVLKSIVVHLIVAHFTAGCGIGVCGIFSNIYKQLFDSWNLSDWCFLLVVAFWVSVFCVFRLALVFWVSGFLFAEFSQNLFFYYGSVGLILSNRF